MFGTCKEQRTKIFWNRAEIVSQIRGPAAQVPVSQNASFHFPVKKQLKKLCHRWHGVILIMHVLLGTVVSQLDEFSRAGLQPVQLRGPVCDYVKRRLSSWHFLPVLLDVRVIFHFLNCGDVFSFVRIVLLGFYVGCLLINQSIKKIETQQNHQKSKGEMNKHKQN